MFESLSDKLQLAFRKLKGAAHISEKNIEDGLREVKLALLEADVNFHVVKDFIERVKGQAIGQEVLKSISPAQQIVKIVKDELTKLLGENQSGITFAGNRKDNNLSQASSSPAQEKRESSTSCGG